MGLDLLPWALGRRVLGLSAGIRDRDGAVRAKTGCAGSPLVWEGGPFISPLGMSWEIKVNKVNLNSEGKVVT